MLTKCEIQYYERQLLLEEISLKQQEKLKEASVLVIGAGGLGCPALIYLATSGIGKIGIVDYDKVNVSNLHRQVLYTFDDLEKKKAEVAAEKIKKINPFIQVKTYPYKVEKHNIKELLSQYQVILDCPDNYETRYIVERAAMELNKTVIYGSVFRFEGQIATFKSGTACYYCAFPGDVEGQNQDIDSDKGIFAPITAIIGVMQAAEAIKEILNINKRSQNTLWTINLLDNKVREYQIEKNTDCLVCGKEGKKAAKIKVSVIVTAYNEEKYLDRCLKTIVNQTLEDIEIIIVDDGSQDGTYDICEKYHKDYPEKITVIHKKNEGIGLARNSGIDAARGEYIGFVDGDDWVEQDMYKSMYDTAKKNHSDVVVCDVRKIFVSENRESVEVSLPDESGQIDIGKYIKDGLNPAYSWNKLYKKEIWDRYKFKKMVYEDLDIVLTILSNCDVVSYVQKPFNTYYKRPDSITTSYTDIRLMDIMQAYKDAAYHANEKYRNETVFCVAKRILINMKTPGLVYYMADFIELIHELMSLFEKNAYIAEDRTVKEILEYKGKKTIPKDIYYAGGGSPEQTLNHFVKHYKVAKQMKSPENGNEMKSVIGDICRNGGIFVKADIQFHVPIGGMRTNEFFLVLENKNILMFGVQKGHKFIKMLDQLYDVNESLEQNIQSTLKEYGMGKSTWIGKYEVIS